MKPLTPHERQIAALLGRGLTVNEIAVWLGVSHSAVSCAHRRASEKVGVYNRFQLAKHAQEQGWV